MPHQCTRCKKTYEDGSTVFLSGCPSCGGKEFRHVRVQDKKWGEGQLVNYYIGAWDTITIIHRGRTMGILSDLFRPNIEKLKKRGDVERLIRALQHRDWHIRMDAVEALGVMGDERGVAPLIECLKDESKHVRREAAIALGTLGDKQAIEPLINALKSEWDDSETPFIEAIERLGERTSIQPLIKAYKYRSKWVRGEEDESLGKIQDVMRTEPAVTVLRDEEKTLEWESEMLQRIGDAREIEPIIEALNYETALSRWRDSFIRGRIEQGQAPDEDKPPRVAPPAEEETPEEGSLNYIKKKAKK
jgi:HEAT repeat protein/DNA-directed RNA polymerase subunit RPC12/RpoP